MILSCKSFSPVVTADTKSVNSDKCVTPYENLPEGVMLNFPTLLFDLKLADVKT